MRETANNARGRWPAILATLGIEEKFLKNAHGPCPICHGKTRFRFDDQLNGSFYCNYCGAGDGFELLKKFHGWDFARAAKEVDAIVDTCPEVYRRTAPKVDKAAYMMEMFKGSTPMKEGDPVWQYLTNRCKTVPAVGTDIRYHPALKHTVDGTTHPAMLAVMRGLDGKGCGMHRTYLTMDGQKADVSPVRMSYGSLGVVRLGGLLAEGGTIGIAEGIETALSAHNRFGIKVWAAICANGLKAFEPIVGVDKVIIMSDADSSFTGQEASFCLAKRLTLRGISVEVMIPEGVDVDWNDVERRSSGESIWNI